jgi:hypothetical protein
MIKPGTPTWRGGQNHRSSTIDLVIASNAAAVSMAEIASDIHVPTTNLCVEKLVIAASRKFEGCKYHGGKFGIQLKIMILMKRFGATNM